MNNKAIICKNLTKKFGDFKAVDQITFDVDQGEIFGFLGANGAGKTTAMRMLMRSFIPEFRQAQPWQASMYTGSRKKLKPALVI